jgi:hypothetical protein
MLYLDRHSASEIQIEKGIILPVRILSLEETNALLLGHIQDQVRWFHDSIRCHRFRGKPLGDGR